MMRYCREALLIAVTIFLAAVRISSSDEAIVQSHLVAPVLRGPVAHAADPPARGSVVAAQLDLQQPPADPGRQELRRRVHREGSDREGVLGRKVLDVECDLDRRRLL